MSRRSVRHADTRRRHLSRTTLSGVFIMAAGLATGSALAVSSPLPPVPRRTHGPATSAQLRPADVGTHVVASASSTGTTGSTTLPTSSTSTTTTRDHRTTRATTTTASQSQAPTPLNTREDGVLDLTNQNRVSRGCRKLTVDRRLIRAAREHAEDMVDRNFFDHKAPDGSDPGDRAREEGFTSGVGENIAVGYSSAASVMTGWMNSPGHRANILNCDYSVIGIGFAEGTALRAYGPGAWVQVFGRS